MDPPHLSIPIIGQTHQHSTPLPSGAQGLPSDVLFIDMARSRGPGRLGRPVRMVRIPRGSSPADTQLRCSARTPASRSWDGPQYGEVWVGDHVGCVVFHCMPQFVRTLTSLSGLLAKVAMKGVEPSPQPVHPHSSTSFPSSIPRNPSSTTHALPSSGALNASHAFPTTSRPGGLLPSSSIASTTLASVVLMTL